VFVGYTQQKRTARTLDASTESWQWYGRDEGGPAVDVNGNPSDFNANWWGGTDWAYFNETPSPIPFGTVPVARTGNYPAATKTLTIRNDGRGQTGPLTFESSSDEFVVTRNGVAEGRWAVDARGQSR